MPPGMHASGQLGMLPGAEPDDFRQAPGNIAPNPGNAVDFSGNFGGTPIAAHQGGSKRLPGGIEGERLSPTSMSPKRRQSPDLPANPSGAANIGQLRTTIPPVVAPGPDQSPTNHRFPKQ
ncbi:MAG: hypothetical protein R2855_03115 [Thermomicrobiales bacterium]